MNASTTAPSPVSTPSRFGITATLLVAAVYCVAVHVLIVDHTMPSLTLLVITAPWLAAGASAVSAAARAKSMRRGATTIVVGLGLVLSACVVWGLGAWLHGRVDVPIFAESFVFLLSLTLLFAASLFGDREAFVTRLARIARRGSMPPTVVRYTRCVTAGWVVFFALAALASAVLFVTQSRELWSAFVNLALWPLTAVAFALEYAIRIRVLPDVEHSSPLVGVRTFIHRDDVGIESAQDAGR